MSKMKVTRVMSIQIEGRIEVQPDDRGVLHVYVKDGLYLYALGDIVKKMDMECVRITIEKVEEQNGNDRP